MLKIFPEYTNQNSDLEDVFSFQNNTQSSDTEEMTLQKRYSQIDNLDTAERLKITENTNGALKFGLQNPEQYNAYKDFLYKQQKSLDFINMEKEAPVTVGIYMSDFLSATNMQDNVQQLAQLEKHFAQLSRKPRNYILEAGASRLGEQYQSKPKGFNTFEAAGYGLLSGLNSGKRGLQTVFNDFLLKMNYESYISEDVQKQLRNASDEAIIELAASFYPDDEGARNNLINMYKGYRDAFAKQATDLFENAPKWLEKAQQTGGINEFIFDVSAGIAQLAPMVAASVATGGGTVAPFLTGLVMNYGQTLDQYRQDPLALQENAREAAMINAFLSAPLDAFGAKGIGKAFIKPKTATGHALKTWLTGAGHEGVTEYAQAYPELLAKQYAYGKFDNFEWSAIGGFLNEAFSADFQKDALYQGTVGAAAGGSLGAFGIKSEFKNKAKQITRLVEAQKLAKEQPEIFKNLVGQLKNGGVDIPDIYVPASAVEALRQERSAELTDFDKQPLDVFLDEAGISHEEYGFAAASGGSLQISGENIHKAMQTSIGGRLLQNDAFSISSEFATDGMDSFLGALYQQKEKIDNLSKAVEAQQNQTEEINSDFDEYTESMLKDEAELSPEMFAEVQNVQAYMDGQVKAYNEENYFTQQIANDIEENTKLTDNPYNETQSKTLASLFMAEIKTYAENYNIPLQEAYKQRRPLFLGNVASTQDIDTLIARAKQEAGLANFNKDAVERENALYQQQEAEAKLQGEIAEWENVITSLEKKPRNNILMLKQTPLAMHLVGADFKELHIAPHAFDGLYPAEKTNPEHNIHPNIDKDILKKIPQALADPVAVYQDKDNNNRFIFITDITDKKGATVVIPVDFKGNTDRAEINIILSVFAKNNKKDEPSMNWFLEQAEKLVYVNRNKDKYFWQKNKRLLKDVSAKAKGVMSAGTNSLWDVSQSLGLNIYNESDLVKLKNQYPTFYQLAYHGTPHNFDKFTLDHIGSGEGEQAHGWGLYFAKDKEISENYRKHLATNIYLDDEVFYNGIKGKLEKSTGNSIADDALLVSHGDIDKAISDVQSDVDYGIPEAKEAITILQDIKNNNRLKSENKGQLFEVDIPENDVLLDEDKEYKEQSSKVKKLLKKVLSDKIFSEYLKEGQTLQDFAEQELMDFENGFTGGNIYDRIKDLLGSDKEASLLLNQHGIKGITYDGKQDGRCFVVFDDNAISVLEKYYQEQNSVIQGSITPVEGAKSIIRFFTATDISTGFHEFGHYMRFSLEQKSKLENARIQDLEDWKTTCEFVGAKEGEVWTREQEEKFADAVLEYLHSGEAPNNGLKRVFNNIARWLTRLYEKISRFGVEINPEIKAVFDRQLATEKEILAARQKLGIAETNPILSSIQERDLAFLSPEKRERFNALVQDSDIDAYGAMTEKKGKELEEHKKIWNSNAELAYQLDNNTVLLEQIIDEGGIYIDEDLREQYRESLVETHRQRSAQYNAIFTSDKNKSVDIELAAERFGFEGPGAVDSFMGHIASLPNKERFIAEYVAEQEILWRSGWKAEEMVLNDKAEEALDILADGLAEKVGTVSLSRKQLHKAVRDSIKKGKIGDVEALIDKYETAARENSLLEKAQARKIAKLEETVIRERLAFIEKKRIALAVVREKYKAKEMRNKGVRYVRRAAKTKPANIDFEYSEQIKYLAEKFGFTGKSLAPRDRANLEPIGQFVEKKDIDASVFPEWILASPVDEKINYKSLSVEEFGELMQVFKVLEHNGKDLKQVEIAGKKQNLEGLVKSLESTAESLQSKRGITDWEKNNKVKNGALAKLRKLASDITNYTYTFFALDGYRKGSDQVDGIFYQTFLKPLYDAQDVSYKLNREIKHKLDEALAPIKKRTKAQRKEAWTLDIPMSREVQRHWGTHNNWNYEKMIMVALNMGNADNMKKLMDGYGWTREHLDIITARMTAEDWNMVQDIWDTVNMLYPSMNAVYKEINGIPLKKVEANQLQTKYGVMRGGYFPLVFDSRLADIDTTKRLEFEKMQENSFSVNIAKAADGFTKDRKSGVKIPVLLSFDVIGRHVQDTVQYISFAKPVHEMSKIIRNKDFEGMYKDKFGVDIYNGLEAWLANIAKPQKERLTEYENIFEKARELGTVYALGYNIKTAVMSFTGFAPVVHEIGLVNTTKGMLHMLKNGREAYREIQAISPLMADRPKNINQDIAQNLAKYNPTNAPTISAEVFGKKYDFYWSDIQRFAFSMVTATDMMVSSSAWIGAYHKALQENGGDIENARAYADLVLERTQSSGTAMHLTALQRGNGLKKIITMFMTYSLNYYNNLAYQTRGLREGKVSALEYASWILWYHTMPAILTVMINGLWNDGAVPSVFGDDEEERKKAWKEYGKEVFLYSLVQGIPVLRNLSSVYEYNQSNVSGSSIIDKGLTSSVQSLYYAGQTFFSLFDDSVDGDKALGKFIKHSIDATSYLTAVPAHKVLQLYDKANSILDWYMENR